MFIAFFRLCLRAFSWFTSACVTAVVLLFVINNTKPVELSFWPLSVSMAAPLWLLTLVLFALGFCLGGFVMWITTLPHRRAAKAHARDAAALRARLDDLSRQAAAHAALAGAPQADTQQSGAPREKPPLALPL